MDQLWAPWRLSYVANPKPAVAPGEGAEDCFICRGLAATADRENLIVRRTALSVVILNRFPYNNGHILVAPMRHVGLLDQLTPDELLDQQLTLREIMGDIRSLMSPDGFNVGLNLGRSAGAGLPGHLHWHAVPRWTGDTNFMPIFGDVKVMVQSLDTLWQLLTQRQSN